MVTGSVPTRASYDVFWRDARTASNDYTRPIDKPSLSPTKKLQKNAFIADHPAFRWIVNCTIVVSSIQIGVATDLQTSGLQDVWLTCDHVFTTVFVLEMIIMISVLGCSYLKDAWLLFDGFVAMAAALDSWFLPLVVPSGNLGFLRQFRLLRLLRIAKVTRVVPELAVVVEGLMNSVKSMLWVFVLLLVMLYACGICCVHVLGRSDSGYPGYQDDQQIINQQLLRTWNNYEFFGTVYRAMLTLFGMVLLSEWTVARKVHELHSAMVPLLGLVVVLVSFGVLNVIIGIVVDKTTAALHTLRSEKEDAAQRARADTAVQLTGILFQFDTDEDNHFAPEELDSCVDHQYFKQLLIQLNLPPNFTALELFRMLDTNASGKLSKTEFVDGIVRLVYNTDFQRQCALSASLGTLHHEVKRLQIQMLNVLQRLEQRVSEPPGHVRINTSLAGSAPSPGMNVNACSLFGNAVGFEVDAPDAHPDLPHRSWKSVRSDVFVVSSADPTPIVSSRAEHSAGDDSMGTFQGSWEPLKTASVVPTPVGHATGHVTDGSNIAKFKDLQLLGYVPVMRVRQNEHACQGQTFGTALSPNVSCEDGPNASKRLYKV